MKAKNYLLAISLILIQFAAFTKSVYCPANVLVNCKPNAGKIICIVQDVPGPWNIKKGLTRAFYASKYKVQLSRVASSIEQPQSHPYETQCYYGLNNTAQLTSRVGYFADMKAANNKWVHASPTDIYVSCGKASALIDTQNCPLQTADNN